MTKNIHIATFARKNALNNEGTKRFLTRLSNIAEVMGSIKKIDDALSDRKVGPGFENFVNEMVRK